MPLCGVILLCALISLCYAQDGVIHLPIYRRGGAFLQNSVANLTYISQSLSSVTSRYLYFSRAIDGNRLHRTWSSNEDADAHIFDEVGIDGRWYATLHIGTPPQALEVDLNMLTPDFYHLMTTSGKGTKLDTFATSSFEPSTIRAHLDCTASTDLFHFNFHTGSPSTRLTLPICQPSKSSTHTLFPSGSLLGLAPFTTLSQLTTPPLLHQLHSQSPSLITHKIWSLTLLDSITGILTLGDTLARQIEHIKISSEINLNHLSDTTSLDQNSIETEIRQSLDFLMPPSSTHEEHFKWTSPLDNIAPRGWWQTLMTGVWINGVKVLKNQPVILDVNCPVIIAPRSAARHVYAHVSAGTPIPTHSTTYGDDERDDREDFTFHAFPCLNPPAITFEIASWPFPIFTQDSIGNSFSLGKLPMNDPNVDTGFCVGTIVGMDFRGEEWADVGLRDTWILGEPFFRGLGVVGDLGDGQGKGVRIGLRKY